MLAGLIKHAGNPVAILAVVVGVLFGLYKWEGYKTARAKAEVEGVRKSLVMAEQELRNAESVNRGALLAAENAAKEAERQAQIAQAAAKKSQDRLRENNLLRKDIQNAKDNPPVPDAIELIIDAQRVRGAVPGNGPAPSGADESGNAGKADTGRPEVSPEAVPAS